MDPLAPVLAEPRPWLGLAVDALEARAALERLDLLQELRLETEWREEWDGAIRRLEHRPLALLTLAEGIRDRGHILEAIRLGRRLLGERQGQWDERLLRVVFPLPFRDLLESESERYGIDPMLYAGLVRQESTFRPAVRSRVGATGLAQIMPPTGRWLAPRVGIAAPQYEDRLLTVPEINLRMGALYLSDLLKRYGGAADLALAGYNAGPGRADRWRRELAYDRDIDAFREAIPFNETRHYVKIVLRNALVYQRLYQSPPPALSASPGDGGAALATD
jgi:soluble lytic murein transglycosylase